MATRAFACPKCKTKLTAPEGAARFRCPTCKTVLSAPGEGAAPDAPMAPPAAPPAPAPAPLPPLAPSDADDQQLVGHKLGSYEVTRVIGRGGLGTVYEAVQEGLNRRVALKVLAPSAASDPSFLTAFRREAQAAAKLNHPHVVQTFDICEEEGLHFIAMEFVDGDSLTDRIRQKRHLPVAEGLEIAAKAAKALDHANEQMLIHRNIKPANILFNTRGGVKLSDLGLSKSLEQSAVGIVEGTFGGPVYMAPELARSPQLADCRSDIYSLGCVLYHALTGQPPFAGPSVSQLLQQHASQPFPSAKALFPRVPKAVDELLRRMCAKDPAERFQTHGELLEEVEILLEATAVRSPSVEKAGGGSGRRWAIIGGVAAGVVGLAVVLFLVLGGGKKKDAEHAKAPAPAKVEAEAPTPPEPAPHEIDPDTVPGTAYAPEPGTVPPAVPAPPEPKAEPVVPPPAKGKGPDAPPPGAEPKGDAPEWQAQLDAAKAQAEAAARAGNYGQAIAALEALTQDNDSLPLRAAVAAAAAAIRQEARSALRAALRTAAARLQQGQYPQARAALQAVVDHFGTPAEVAGAKAALASVAQHEQLRAAAAQVSKEAGASAQAGERRAAAQARLAKALEPIAEKLKAWKLREAAEAMGALRVGDKAIEAELASRKSAIDALIDLRHRMIQHIKTAKPPLDKRAARITGLNGPLTDADENEIRCTVKFGAKIRIEKHPWAKLRAVSGELLAKRVAKENDATDALATALFLQLLGDKEKAREHRERAEALDAEAKPPASTGATPAEAKAARALASALGAIVAGRHQEGRAALAAYEKDYSATAHAAAHAKSIQVAKAYKPITVPGAPTPQPAPPKPPTKGTPKPPTKGTPKPPTPKGKTPPKAKAAPKAKPKKPAISRGPSIVLSKTAEGAARSLAAAFGQVDGANATITVEAGTYGGGITRVGATTDGLVLRGTGEKLPRLAGGSSHPTILSFPADVKSITIERLEFGNAQTAIFLGPRCSATLREVVALQDVDVSLDKFPSTPVSITASLLAVSGLSGATARGSGFLCDETPIDYGTFTGCIVAGDKLSLQHMRLTDCIVIGPVTLLGGNQFNHVTVLGPITIPEDSTGNAITNCIVESIETWRPDRNQKEKPPVALTIKSTAIRRGDASFHKDLVKADDKVRAMKVGFANPKAGDFRLEAGSPVRGKGADKGDLGCRFPKELLDLLARARRYPTLLRPPSRRH
ncbi:MAG: serine/threonine protein kinase [Candidatus Brocadiae bacterium]|nr:serine/threonine protein kinase [Candidatus Brocadiia bacterium]